MKRLRVVFATNNSHKLKEAREILGNDFEIVSLAEAGVSEELPETSDTLSGNAFQKARRVRELTGADCFADDTGLSVDALDGRPGVYSARYAGEHCDPSDNIALLLKEMDGKTDRTAHFSTVIALLTGDREIEFEGRVDGSIATVPIGDGGFGYDSVFVADETGRTFASMTAGEKNAISHRGRAMRALSEYLLNYSDEK